jgi:hypothetical protein
MENIVWDIQTFQDHLVGELSDLFSSWIDARPARKRGHWGIPIGNIPLRHFNPGLEGKSSHGLYIFYKASGIHPTVYYVGKSTSRGFSERIPAHIETNSACWFNTLTQRCVATFENQKQDDFRKASQWCCDNLSVALIPIDVQSVSKKNIELLERRMRHPLGLNPLWNSCSQKARGKHIEFNDTLCNDFIHEDSKKFRVASRLSNG